MSMSEFDLIENCVLIFIGFLFLMFLMSGKGDD